jgi:hypothetical protein
MVSELVIKQSLVSREGGDGRKKGQRGRTVREFITFGLIVPSGKNILEEARELD